MEYSYEDRRAELEAFKTVNLSVIASQYGYRIVAKKTTRHSVFMASANDKIVIGKNGQQYVYWSVFNEKSSGTVIDFAQNVIEPGCTLPRVREILRPYLSVQYCNSIADRYREDIQEAIKPSPTNLLAVAARHSRFETVTGSNHYLCQQRHVPPSLLSHRRLQGTIQYCRKRGSVVFPHFDVEEGANGWTDPILTGYEIKGTGVNLFSKSGRKGLWLSNNFPHDRVLAVAESGLDGLSYLALHDRDTTRMISISGQTNSRQPILIDLSIKELEEGATVAAAFDNDEAGDSLTQRLFEIVKRSGRGDIQFIDDRPETRGADWNDVLRQDSARTLFTLACNAP